MTAVGAFGFAAFGAFVVAAIFALRKLRRDAESERAEELLKDAIDEAVEEAERR